MAFEAELIYETELPIQMTVANGTGIEKGTVLAMSDPFTAAASAAASDVVAGIAASEKIANDGNTKLSVYRGGIFKMKASGAITVGDPVATSATANHVASVVATSNFSGAKILGIAMETAATAETLLVELRPTVQTTQL